MAFDADWHFDGWELEPERVRAACEAVLASFPEVKLQEVGFESVLADPDGEPEEDDDLEVWLRIGRTEVVLRLRKAPTGVDLSLESDEAGNRSKWRELGELAEALAAKLGGLLDEEAYRARIEALEGARPGGAEARSVVIRAWDREGQLVKEAKLELEDWYSGRPPHPLLTDEGRMAVNARRVEVGYHDASGTLRRRLDLTCDGYGRIVSQKDREL